MADSTARSDPSQGAGDLFAGLTGASARHAVWVVLVAVVLTVAAAVYLARNLAIDTNTQDMLSPNLPFRQLDERVDHLFPQLSDNLVAVVEAGTPDQADAAASALAKALAKDTANIRSVFYPRDKPHFRQDGFLYLTPAELDQLSTRLAQAQPFLGALWATPNLQGVADLLAKAISHQAAPGADGGDQGVPLARALNRIAGVAEDVVKGRPGILSWQSLIAGDAASPPFRRVLVLRPRLDYASLAPGQAAMTAVRETARKLDLTEANGVRVRLTGSAALKQEELASVSKGMGIAGALSLILVTVLLIWGLRSARLFFATIVTLLMGVTWTAAFALLAVGALNLISVAFAVLFIGLGVDFAIHYGLRYREAREVGEDHSAAVRTAGGSVGGALTLAAVCAAIGFYSFLPTDYRGLAELGLIAGTGMFIALIANLTVLPALLTLSPPRVAARPVRRAELPAAGAGRLFAAIGRHRRAVLIAATALAVASFALVPEARFDFDPLHLKDPHTESVRTLYDLAKDPRISPYAATVLAPDLAAADALAKKLAALPEVEQAQTLSDFVPPDQQQKLDTIFSMALFLGPSIAGPEKADRGPDERRVALAALLPALAHASQAGTAEEKAAARLKAVVSTMTADQLAEFERRLLVALPLQVERLRAALKAQPFTAEDLPAQLRRRYVAADGTARISVVPKADLRNRAALIDFVHAVRKVAPQATGAPIVIYEAGRTVVRAFLEAGAIAVAAIALLLIVLLRRWKDVAIVFAPLVLAAGLTLAATVLTGLSFNFANVIVLPLLFGLGVAGAVHLVTRARRQGSEAAFRSSTPRAVVFSALTTIGSFASIALSSHPGTASMGVLLTIAVVLTLVTTLLVLPALLARHR